MPTYKSAIPMLALLVAGIACGQAPDAKQAATKSKSEDAAAPAPAVEAEAEAAAQSEAQSQGDEAGPKHPHVKLEPAPPLTEEEKRLIAADVKDLAPEERRKRAYALRKQIMQNPDSPSAQAMHRAAEAIKRGELTPPAELTNKSGHDHPPAPAGEAPIQ